MSLAQKLILFALAVALIPLSATGFTVVKVGEGALRQRIREHQLTAAVAVSAKVSQAVEELAQNLASLSQRFDVRDLNEAETQGMLQLVYQQSPDISVAVLQTFDGAPLTDPVFLSGPDAELSGHLGSDLAGVEELRRRMPGVDAGEKIARTVLLSPAYYPGGPARVAVTLPCCGGGGVPVAISGIEIALRPYMLRMEGVDTGPGSQIFVVDRKGKVIVHPELAPGTELATHGAVNAMRSGAAGVARYRFGDRNMAGAYVPMGALGWGVVVEQPEAVAFEAVATMRRQILLWTGGTALLVVLASLLFAARLRGVLAQMVAGARHFGKGALYRRIEVERGDEFGELATTMNRMAEQLAASYKELEQWNQTLERRVVERTEELKQAQAQLLTQSKLAAIGQLGAGVAHEVNNPLAGILGYTQLLIRRRGEDDPDLKTLRKIEEAAKRCKAITVNLLRFSERGLVGRTETAVNDVANEVIDAFRGSFEDNQARIEVQLDPELPTIVANSGQVALVLINLMSNAKNAMSAGGTVTLRTEPHEDGVAIVVADTGHGIAAQHLERIFEPFFTTKAVWTGVGLGLSVAYRVVSDHGGRIEVESREGVGTTMTVILPLQPPAEDASAPVLERDAVMLE